MNEEKSEELMNYNLEYLEAVNSEEIFGGDYTSAVDLKYSNIKIEQLQQEIKQLKEQLQQRDGVIEEAIEFLNKILDRKAFVYSDLRKIVDKLIKYKGDNNE